MSERIGKFMRVERNEIEENGKTCIWAVLSNDDSQLGTIEWETGWRQYVFVPGACTIYSAGCLRDMASFLEKSRNTRRPI